MYFEINVFSKTVTAFKFFVKKKSGLLIKQNLPKSVLSNALSSIVTSRQEKLAIVEETDTSTYIDKRTCFSLVLKTRIKKIDISEFEVAVAQAWLDKRQSKLFFFCFLFLNETLSLSRYCDRWFSLSV